MISNGIKAVKLAEVMAQSQANAQQLGDFKGELNKRFDGLIADFNNRFESLITEIRLLREDNQKIRESVAPDFSTMAAWAAVVIGIVTAFGSLAGCQATREFGRFEKQQEQLNAKLQKEFTLAIETVHETSDGMDRLSLERHANTREMIGNNAKKIEDLRQFVVSQVAADLQELRERRKQQQKP